MYLIIRIFFLKKILAWDYEKNHWLGRHMGGEERKREDEEGEMNYMCTEMTSKGVGLSTALLIFVPSPHNPGFPKSLVLSQDEQSENSKWKQKRKRILPAGESAEELQMESETNRANNY